MTDDTDRLVYSCAVKAVAGKDAPPKRGPSWIGARRGTLKIFEDRLQCGDWTIPFTQITETKELRFRVAGIFEGRILQVRTNEQIFHFGVNPWANPVPHLPTTPAVERITLGYSPLSVALRVLLVGYLAYWLWRRFGS